MKCKVCGTDTRINWGNASAVICENCMNTDAAKTLIENNHANGVQSSQLASESSVPESDLAEIGDIDPKLSGIGGWLILPAIGLVLGPIIGVIGLIASIGLYSDVARAGYGDVYALEIIVLLGLLAFTIYAAVLFFQKKGEAPKTMILLYSISLGASAVLLGVELSSGAEMFAAETGKQLVRDIVAAAIWIPYFRVSKRVKSTFVR